MDPNTLMIYTFLFDKVHVTGANASCPGEISSGESSSDDDVLEMSKKLKIVLLLRNLNQQERSASKCPGQLKRSHDDHEG
jgi:hypothetical protein